MNRPLIIVRGGGDLATGIIQRLWRSGFCVLVLEIAAPAAIRRQVSLCEAVYQEKTKVEDMEGILVSDLCEMRQAWKRNQIPVVIDAEGIWIQKLKPEILIDAILAKRNLGTTIDMAPLTIGLGPGFTAGKDVHVVIETKRGHNLGRIIYEGTAIPNTGIPGIIAGYGKERVLHAPVEGTIKNVVCIGDSVKKGDVIAYIQKDGIEYPVEATLTGILRGLIREGYYVTKGFKIADIDPRESEINNCFTISDKARALGGSALEMVCAHQMQMQQLHSKRAKKCS